MSAQSGNGVTRVRPCSQGFPGAYCQGPAAFGLRFTIANRVRIPLMNHPPDLPEWERLLAAARHLQWLVPGTVLVGGTAAAMHAGHRVSVDGDHVLDDLRDRFDDVLAALEQAAGWKTERVQRPPSVRSMQSTHSRAEHPCWLRYRNGSPVPRRETCHRSTCSRTEVCRRDGRIGHTWQTEVAIGRQSSVESYWRHDDAATHSSITRVVESNDA